MQEEDNSSPAEQQAEAAPQQPQKNCPRCGSPTDELMTVGKGMKVALKTTGAKGGGAPPEFVCPSCHEELSGQVSQGVKLRVEQEAREKNKVMMWKSRVNLIKKARQLMSTKSYSEAAVSYEKYLRIIEVIYDKPSGGLTPEIFNHSSRSKELTVIASVYWDLLRIYDTSPRYGDRMRQTAEKLAQFLPYSTIFPDIIKKAEVFQKSARNPNIVREFLKKTRKTKVGCFIASAVFLAPKDPRLQTLRAFRDEVLKASPWGRSFVLIYYKHSPRIAHWLFRHPVLASLLKAPLILVAHTARALLRG